MAAEIKHATGNLPLTRHSTRKWRNQREVRAPNEFQNTVPATPMCVLLRSYYKCKKISESGNKTKRIIPLPFALASIKISHISLSTGLEHFYGSLRRKELLEMAVRQKFHPD